MPAPEAVEGEFGLIARFFRGLDRGEGVSLGNGDDAAVLDLPPGESLAVSVDTMVDGRHFPTGSPADLVSYRAVAAAASDLAAMGAMPLAMNLALTLPSADGAWLRQCRAGLERAVQALSLPLVGGDLTRGPLTLSVQVLGAVPRDQTLTRAGAQPGDRLCVSGPLGKAAAGLAVLQGRCRVAAPLADDLLRHFWCPAPAFELGVALRGQATAAIDISDGLLADVAHLAVASGVSVHIDAARIALDPDLLSSFGETQALSWALAGGEDYRLCFTLPPASLLPAECVVIGEVGDGEGVHCAAAKALGLTGAGSGGYKHF